MALREINECLWDERWIKNLMKSLKLEDTNMGSFPSYVGTTSSARWTTYKDQYEGPLVEIVKKSEPEVETMKPVLFDPKELDIDVKD